MKIDREHLSSVLEVVGAAAAKRPSFQQASCFAFQNGRVTCFDGDLAISADSPLEDVEGAVPAYTLLEYLRKLGEETLEVDVDKGVLRIKGRGKRIRFSMEKEVLLPKEAFHTPTEWSPLPEEFCEAALSASECAGKDEKYFESTCVLLRSDKMEAYDGSQMYSHSLAIGLSEPVHVQRKALRQTCIAGATHFSLAQRWTHFRSEGFVLSCLRFPGLTAYPVSDWLSLQGERASLPGALVELAEQASLAASENGDDLTYVSLKKDEAMIKGEGVGTLYEARTKVSYDGPPVTFRISPSLLKMIVTKGAEVWVSPTKLVVDGGSWRYGAVLRLPEKKE